MNTIDDRITAALHARADALTEADLSPAAPPTSRAARPQGTRWIAPLLAAAVVGILAVATVIAVQLGRFTRHAEPATSPTGPASTSMVAPLPVPSQSGPAPSYSQTGPAPSSSQTGPAPSHSQTGPAPSSSPSSPATTTGTQPSASQSQVGPTQSASRPSSSVAPPAFVLGYQPLWPFASYAEAERWRTEAGGSQPWHLDAGQTALDFTRSYLGFAELDRVTGTRMDERGAHVGVGYRDPNGQLRTSATLHLVRYGTAKDSPWEVVGSDDTTLSLEQPAYGSTVTSPMTIGGHITGVDENIVVSVLAGQSDRSTLARVPAGGDRSAWTTGPVPFAQRGVLTLVASTGGHLQQVERFAIQGVRT